MDKKPPYGVDCESCPDLHQDGSRDGETGKKDTRDYYCTNAQLIAKYQNLHDHLVGGVHLEPEKVSENRRCLFRPVSLERVEEFYEFLMGKVPDGIKVSSRMTPKLSKRMAFTIVWFLQEQTQVFPDHYEQCRKCKGLYNTENDGHNGKCDGCDP